MRPHPPTSRHLCAAFAGVFALGFASAAGAVSLSNLSVFLDPGNTADQIDNTAPNYREIQSDVAFVTSGATGFVTRYAAGVYADSGGGTFPPSQNITLNASYTISFDVTNAVGSAWRLDIATSRIGARTAVDDGGGTSAFALGAVTGTRTGAGSLTGSLDLGAIGNTSQGTSVDIPFSQSGTASISGTGNGTVTLNFTFTATAQSVVPLFGSQGDEAAIRMGIADSLPTADFSAGTYPGAPPTVPNRTAANDGHFVDLDLFDLGPIPEPDTELLLGMGLAMLAVQGRRRRTG